MSIKISHYGPTCPNHGCPLEGLPFPLTEKGTGICPVSGYPFDYEIELDTEEMMRDKNGNMIKKKSWNVSGEEH